MGACISIGISPRERLEDWATFSRELEQNGVEEMWLIDSQLAMKDAYIGLTLAAANTERMRLGTGVSNMVTRHPTVTANGIAAVAELSAGRAILGIGAGDSSVFGIGARPSKVAEVEEALLFFDDVLTGKEGTWQGRRFRLPGPTIDTPVYLAVSRERMCRLAGRFAAGAIVMGPAQPDVLAEQVGWIEEGIAAAGRGREDVRICFIATMSAHDDDAKALADVTSWATGQARLLADAKQLPASLEPFRAEILRARDEYDFSEHLSTRAGHSGAISEDLVRVLAVAGTTAECVGRLNELLGTGIDDLIFPLMGGARLRRLQNLNEKILPNLAT
jgi:5,10-methylenetetrahydromethanopterin reductase